jgi:hypothetical protein
MALDHEAAADIDQLLRNKGRKFRRIRCLINNASRFDGGKNRDIGVVNSEYVRDVGELDQRIISAGKVNKIDRPGTPCSNQVVVPGTPHYADAVCCKRRKQFGYGNNLFRRRAAVFKEVPREHGGVDIVIHCGLQEKACCPFPIGQAGMLPRREHFAVIVIKAV